jgi:hypothetical protein
MFAEGAPLHRLEKLTTHPTPYAFQTEKVEFLGSTIQITLQLIKMGKIEELGDHF